VYVFSFHPETPDEKLLVSGNSASSFFPIAPGSHNRGFGAPQAFQPPPTLSPQKQLFDYNGNKTDHEKQKNNANKFL
jgi:hypothetical protein